MTLHLFGNRVFLLLLCLVMAIGCVKNPLNNITPPNGTDDPGEVTATGGPNGTPVTKTIGAPGGTMLSADGKFTITIPAGALSSNLDITIQPIDNEAPGGIAGGYELLPGGTVFSKPVTLAYHYSSADINGSSPYFLYIAMQDSTGAWKEDVVNRDLDTVGNIVSITTPHFSSYAPASSLHLEFGQTVFRINETNFIKVVETLSKRDYSGPADPDNAPFLPVHSKQQLPDDQVGQWSVKKLIPDTAKVGNIAGTGGDVNYTAPGNIDKAQTVNVAAEITGPFVVYIKKKKIILNKVILPGELELIPQKLSFNVQIAYHQAGTNTCFIDNYTDSANFEVDIDGDNVTIANIVNQHPNTVPLSGPDKNGTGDVCTWEPDNTGMVNITGGTGTVTPAGNVAPGVIKFAYITLDQLNTVFPKWQVTSSSGDVSETGGYMLPGFPPAISIVLKDSTQVITVNAPPGAQTGDGKITITPIH